MSRKAVELIAPAGDGVAQLRFDDPERSANVLSMAVVDQLDRCLDELGAMPGVRGLLVTSGKPAIRIAGADVREIALVTEASIAVGHATRVQSLFGRISRLRFPVVAAIRGACLGGGLELALACHLRVVADDPATRLGLPEVKLGLIPGFGGTQRLPRLIGLRRALDLILKGYSLGAHDSRAVGLSDAVLPADGFADAAHAWLRAVVDRGARPRHRPLPLVDRLLTGLSPLRDLYLWAAERRVRQQTKGRYPAPLKAVASLREGLRLSLDEGLEVEAGLVGSLAVSPECKGLSRLFLLAEASKNNPWVDLALARPVVKAGVIGAGIMGAGIAAELARSGIRVRLRDVSVEALRAGLGRARASLRPRRGGDRLSAALALGRISPTLTLTGFGRADIVIEAAVEHMALKQDILEAVEARISPTAVFATNTSALSVTQLQRSARYPGRVVGMHFFNPVGKMPLVEVVRGDATTDAAVATVVNLARAIGKQPVVVADGPGFLVNRVLAPYLMESLLLLGRGVDPAAIDGAMLTFGMPMGPLAVFDEVGLDVAHHVAGTLAAAFPERFLASPILAAMLKDKLLGRKVGVGFYRYAAGKRSPNPGLARITRRLGVRPMRSQPERQAIQELLVLAMVNEAMRAVDEGIVNSAGECDLAMVLGTGFPPFRGGLLAFGSTLGTGPLLQTLERFESELGERFQPAPIIRRLHSRGLSLLDAAPSGRGSR